MEPPPDSSDHPATEDRRWLYNLHNLREKLYSTRKVLGRWTLNLPEDLRNRIYDVLISLFSAGIGIFGIWPRSHVLAILIAVSVLSLITWRHAPKRFVTFAVAA